MPGAMAQVLALAPSGETGVAVGARFASLVGAGVWLRALPPGQTPAPSLLLCPREAGCSVTAFAATHSGRLLAVAEARGGGEGGGWPSAGAEGRAAARLHIYAVRADVASGELSVDWLSAHDAGAEPCRCLEFSADGCSLAMLGGAPGYVLSVWAVAADEEARRVTARPLLSASAVPQRSMLMERAATASLHVGTGGRLATCVDGQLRLWSTVTTFTGLKLRGATASFGRAAVARVVCAAEVAASVVAGGSTDGELRIWVHDELVGCVRRDTASAPAHDGAVCALALAAPLGLLMSAGADGVLRWWSVALLTAAAELAAETATASAEMPLLTLAPLHELQLPHALAAVYSGSAAAPPALPCTLTQLYCSAEEAAWAMADTASGCIWRVLLNSGGGGESAGGQHLRTTLELVEAAHASGIIAVELLAATASARRFASAGSDGTVRLWLQRDGPTLLEAARLAHYAIDGSAVAPVAVSAMCAVDARSLLVGFDDGVLHLITVADSMTPRGGDACSGAGDKHGDGELLLVAVVKPFDVPLTALALEAGGGSAESPRMLAAGSKDGGVFFFAIGATALSPLGSVCPAAAAPVTALVWAGSSGSSGRLYGSGMGAELWQLNVPSRPDLFPDPPPNSYEMAPASRWSSSLLKLPLPTNCAAAGTMVTCLLAPAANMRSAATAHLHGGCENELLVGGACSGTGRDGGGCLWRVQCAGADLVVSSAVTAMTHGVTALARSAKLAIVGQADGSIVVVDGHGRPLAQVQLHGFGARVTGLALAAARTEAASHELTLVSCTADSGLIVTKVCVPVPLDTERTTGEDVLALIGCAGEVAPALPPRITASEPPRQSSALSLPATSSPASDITTCSAPSLSAARELAAASADAGTAEAARERQRAAISTLRDAYAAFREHALAAGLAEAELEPCPDLLAEAHARGQALVDDIERGWEAPLSQRRSKLRQLLRAYAGNLMPGSLGPAVAGIAMPHLTVAPIRSAALGESVVAAQQAECDAKAAAAAMAAVTAAAAAAASAQAAGAAAATVPPADACATAASAHPAISAAAASQHLLAPSSITAAHGALPFASASPSCSAADAKFAERQELRAHRRATLVALEASVHASSPADASLLDVGAAPTGVYNLRRNVLGCEPVSLPPPASSAVSAKRTQLLQLELHVHAAREQVNEAVQALRRRRVQVLDEVRRSRARRADLASERARLAAGRLHDLGMQPVAALQKAATTAATAARGSFGDVELAAIDMALAAATQTDDVVDLAALASRELRGGEEQPPQPPPPPPPPPPSPPPPPPPPPPAAVARGARTGPGIDTSLESLQVHLELLQAQEQQLAALEASLVRDFDAALQRLRGERARVVVRVVMAAASRRLVLRAELAVLESTAVRDADLARQLKRVDEEQRAAEAEACVHEKAAADAAARLAALAERCAALSAAAEELIACGGGSDAARSAALMAVYGGTAESGSGEASSVPADAATQRRLLALRQHRLDGDERAAEESAALHALQAVHAKALARAQAAAALASQLRGQAAAWRSETQARLNAITLELPLTAKQIAAGPAQQQLLELLQLPGPLPPAPAAVATAAAPTATAPVLLFPRARLAALRARAGEIDAEVATLLVMRADLSAELEVCKHESRQLQAEARGAAAKAAALSRLKFGRELDIAKLDRATAAQRTVVEAEAQSSATAAAISVAAGSGGAVAGSRDEEAEEAQVAADSAASAAALRRAVQCRTMAVNDAVAQRARKLRAHAALRARESRGGPTASIADALASLAGAVACEAGAISSAGEPVQQRRTAGGSAAATRHAISVLRAASRAAPSRALAAAATASSGDEGSAAGDDDDDLLAFVEAQSEELVALSREASLLRRRQHLPPPPPSPRYIRIATASLGSASAMVDEAPAVVPAATHRIAGLALQPSAPPAQPSQLQLRGHGARRDVSMVKEARAAGVEAAAAGAHAPPPPPLPHQPASLLAVGAWPPPVAGSGSATRPTSARRGSTQPLGAGLARLRPASVGVPPQPPPQLAVIGSGAPSPRRRSVDYKQ